MADELLLECRRFRVVRRRLTSPAGEEIEREVVVHPGAVAIIPMVDAEHVCLIRNFRIAVGKTLIEVPAGTLEPNEPPIETARRELIEETGYTAGRMEPVTKFYMSPGIQNELMHCFVATELTLGDAHREAGEEIQNLVVAWDEAMAMLDRGEIEDSKSIAALLVYDRLRRRK
jgi:ADP-ribose pyrophosphatase